MDNFKAIYRILKYLEEAMGCSEPDYAPIGAAVLGISEERKLCDYLLDYQSQAQAKLFLFRCF